MTLEYKQLEARPLQAGANVTPQAAAMAAAQFANGMPGLNQMVHGLSSGLSAMSRQQSMVGTGAGAGAPLTLPPSSLTTPVSSNAPPLPGQSTTGNSTPMGGLSSGLLGSVAMSQPPPSGVNASGILPSSTTSIGTIGGNS